MAVKEFIGRQILNDQFRDEKPKNVFKDSFKSVEVKLMNYTQHAYDIMASFILGSYGNRPMGWEYEIGRDGQKKIEMVEACLKGETMPLAMELPNFVFCISGIDRVITHQIVRTRVGVVFSQHCTGDNDIRHLDFLLPPAILNGKRNKEVKKWLSDGAKLYSKLLDKDEIGIQDARHIFPQCINTYLYMAGNYFMFRNFVARRLCRNEDLPIQQVAQGIRKEIENVYPLLARYMEKPCKISKKCHFRKNDSIFGGSVYWPCNEFPHDGIITADKYLCNGTADFFRFPKNFRGK